ncbi:MAG TPA: hypothetical protein PKN30_06720 [Flavobacteriales bacterium]|nr:hypothetical protein [Flavobacteriales bacterium]
MMLITLIGRRLALGLVAALTLFQEADAQAYLLHSPDTFLLQRTTNPFKPIGEPVGEFVDIFPAMGQWTLLFEKDGVKRKVKCKDIWGFLYKGVLFRINDEGPIPVRLMTEGEVCYYENGFAHLRMVRDDLEVATYDVGNAAYLSKDLKGPIVPARFKADDTRSPSGLFRTEYPMLEPLYRCIGDNDQMDPIRQCVVDFESGLLGDRREVDPVR